MEEHTKGYKRPTHPSSDTRRQSGAGTRLCQGQGVGMPAVCVGG
jgi:hypothetical protein